MKTWRAVGAVVILGAAALAAPPALGAVSPLVQVTGASPFAVGCAGSGHDPTGEVFEDAEVEPWVAVDPADPSHVAGSWQQDRWSDGGSHGLVASASLNGGTAWNGETFADFSRCPLFAHYGDPDAQDPGREFDRGSDPWVSWGTGSRLHQIALTVSQPSVGLGLNAGILVSHSDDFGATWSHPQAIKEDHGGNVLDDKESLTADPASGYVYAIWDRLVAPNGHADLEATENAIGYRGPTWFASSPNNGETWSSARMIYDPGEINQTIANQIAVEPDGTLVDVFLQINNFKNSHGSRGLNVAVMRSSDHGASWSKPVFVHKTVDATVRTPGDGQALRTGDIAPDIAIDGRTGAIYVVWQDAVSGTPAIYLSKSTDGGSSWSAAQMVSDPPAGVSAFTAAVDVDAAGAVGVTYYDFRNDTSDTATALTDYWIRTSTDGGAAWAPSQRVTPASFDMKKAPVARGYFTGDYEGLDHAGSTFKVFFVQTHNADAGTNPTDVYSADATP
ncbi:sialidase family protein [Candidatus Solirubrobacter pratensis]|uniref:sialidase family protein n=1 Tax=Candidatus Solirubrobacter pratensis TaxID=1298857 RepID=UPI0005660353|nr:sialidase family protein [Candidatus Solirubrobacter pratensis]